MITKRLTLWLPLMLLSLVVRAQQSGPESTESCCLERDPRWVVKFAPLNLLDPDNTVQFGVERLLGRDQSVQVEVGYGWQGIGLWNTTKQGKYADKETWRGRAEWRLYLGPEANPLGIYAAVEGMYKQINVLETSSNGIPCLGLCVPGPVSRTPVQKRVWGGHLKFGYQGAISHHDRLLMDVYGGFGMRYRRANRPDLPAGVTLQEPRDLFRRIPAFPVRPNVAPSLSLGIKFGYAF